MQQRALRLALAGIASAAFMGFGPACSAFAQTIEGDWHGALEVPPTIRIAMHIEKAPDGAFKVLAYNDTQEPGKPASNWALAQTGDQAKLSTPNNGGQRLELKWSPADSAWKGQYFANFGTFPIALTKGPMPPNPKVDGLDGAWLGALDAAGTVLHVEAHLATANGTTAGYFLSPDQTTEHYNLIAARDGAKVTFSIPAVLGSWTGALAADGKTLDGTWSQLGNALPLKLTKK